MNAPTRVSKRADTEALHPTRRQVAASLTSDDPDERAFAYDIIPIIDGEFAGLLAEGERKFSYAEYLTTPEWRQYREGVLARQSFKCVTCPRDATHCHHRTYEHVGWEADDDCVGLCVDCHRKLHPRQR